MKLETFFHNFEFLTDAPNSAAKLREIILQLAVRGKLVSQDSNDEPASILLKRIKLEKERLIKKKQIKKEQLLPTISKDEKYFTIPDTWQWVRLGDIGNWGAGSTPDRRNLEYYGGAIRWFKSGELNDGYIYDSEETITELALQQCSLRENKPGDVLIAMYGATIGKVAILETRATTNQAVCACTCFKDVYNLYIFLILKAYKNYFSVQGAGGAQPNISRIKIIYTVVPLPPLTEQKRIVEKCDRLLSICDEIEKRQQQRQESIVRMNESAIAQFLSSQNPDEFSQHWQRICNNFDLLYSIPETIPKLRQAILQLAVQGKLVSQNPNDEPAWVVLERIKAEKEQLVKEKKIPKDKQLPPVEDSELPYEIPEGWNWVRLGELAKVIEYGTSEKSSELGEDVPIFRMNNIRDGKLLIDNLKYVSAKIKDLPRLYLQNSDLLFNRTNSYDLVGKTGIFRGESNQYTFASYLIRISIFLNYVSPEFINLAMNSTYFRQSQIEPEITQQCGQANFNGTKLKNTIIPLPPLAEQKRIVAKVDRLMSLCDSLEVKLKEARSHSETLMEVAANQILTA